MKAVRIERNQLLSVLSEALDCVEGELLGVTGHHAKRVAWVCLLLGKAAGMSKEELSELAMGALLHDNALTEYREDYMGNMLKPGKSGKEHCVKGEENLQMIPGSHGMAGFVLYHHEIADGSGPFHRSADNTPFGAQLIHLVDEVDVHFPPEVCTRDTPEGIRRFVQEGIGSNFGEASGGCFLKNFEEDWLAQLSDENVGRLILEIPPVWIELNGDGPQNESGKAADIYSLAQLFARIIDYKSPFTKSHSVEIAAKAARMSDYYGFDRQTRAKLYLAGALHDIGKLMVESNILEKPGKLDEEEYRHIQGHAYQTWRLLSKIDGLGDVSSWAACHHEKLNGTGYPFGKSAKDLGHKERLLACLDIYQALTEARPYKEGMSHARAVSILRQMAEKGELDDAVITDIDYVFAADAS